MKNIMKNGGQSTNMKKKLIMGFLVVVILFSAVCGFSLLRIRTMQANVQLINDNWMPSVAGMGWFNGAVSDVARLNLSIALESDTNNIAQLVDQQKKLIEEIDQRLKSYEKLRISGPEEQSASVEEIAASSESLSKMAMNLQAAVSKFNV